MSKNKNVISLLNGLWRVIILITIMSVKGIMVQAQITNPTFIVDVSKPGAVVAPICRGQQLEEFNHQFEGGLYAQLINNPSFEEIDESWQSNSTASWFVVKPGSSNGNLSGQTSGQADMLNSHQNYCAKLTVISVASGSVGLANGGYWGIALKNNTTYKVSFWARKGSNFRGTLRVKLESNEGIVYAQSADIKPTARWEHFTCDLIASGISNVSGANRFVIYASTTGDVYFDVVTVMPPTWKNRPNGLRPDLGEKMDGLKFKYLEFPGGFDAQYASLDRARLWKNSIGPIEERYGSTSNMWKYKNDLYFGLDEYFQLCEDLGAEPVYTVTAGIRHLMYEEINEFCPLDQMQPIIGDILDLLEYCNGSASTTWGIKRAGNGHLAPYNLKYIQIGAENNYQLDQYHERYPLIYNAVKARYPDIKCMYNGICGDWGKDPPRISHTFGNPVDFTCENFNYHNNSVLYNRYDSIDPTCKKISVTEYSNSVKGNGGNVTGTFQDALADAVFMLGCEKNSERMWWTGYGNYGAFAGHAQYGPCLVWNDAVTCFANPDYYMQKMLFSDNQGSRVLPFTQNTTYCYWSATTDTESGKNDILLKVVNKSDKSESVNITLSGAGNVNPVGHSTILLGEPDAENSLTNPENVVPLKGTFAAGGNFKHLFPAYSITVLRMSY
jgi:alpha-L-arabinofuranosidase